MGKRFKNIIISENELEIVISDNQNRIFKISTEDKDILKYYWAVKKEGYPHRGYRKDGQRYGVYLHRELTKFKIVDHKDGDPTNNTRSNLRDATTSLNNTNCVSKKKRAKINSQYKGVCWCTRDLKWISHIVKDFKGYFNGRFETEIEAAKAYDKKALELFGEFAKLNFP